MLLHAAQPNSPDPTPTPCPCPGPLPITEPQRKCGTCGHIAPATGTPPRAPQARPCAIQRHTPQHPHILSPPAACGCPCRGPRCRPPALTRRVPGPAMACLLTFDAALAPLFASRHAEQPQPATPTTLWGRAVPQLQNLNSIATLGAAHQCNRGRDYSNTCSHACHHGEAHADGDAKSAEMCRGGPGWGGYTCQPAPLPTSRSTAVAALDQACVTTSGGACPA